MTHQLQLTCPACEEVEICGPAEMLERLHGLGMMKRAADPPPDLLEELFRGAAERFACRRCARQGLVAGETVGDDWPDARPCAACGNPISGQRLEIFPEALLCAACQRSADAGQDAEREFCPACGAVMTLRLSRGRGPARYEMSCPDCRR